MADDGSLHPAIIVGHRPGGPSRDENVAVAHEVVFWSAVDALLGTSKKGKGDE
jgi:hypothetical protein